MKPTAHKPTWIVYTTDTLGVNFAMGTTPSWIWTALGPRGSDSGIERTAEDAQDKARAAAYLLAEPDRSLRREGAAA